jgi:hypothetical protein
MLPYSSSSDGRNANWLPRLWETCDLNAGKCFIEFDEIEFIIFEDSAVGIATGYGLDDW